MLVVDDREALRLDADLGVGVERIERDDAIVAEHTIVKGRLVLVGRAARAGCQDDKQQTPMCKTSTSRTHVLSNSPRHGAARRNMGATRVLACAPAECGQ